jgi:hypothetical protein
VTAKYGVNSFTAETADVPRKGGDTSKVKPKYIIEYNTHTHGMNFTDQ